MRKRVIVELKENNSAMILVEGLEDGQELYKAYVALTARIMCDMVNKDEIHSLAEVAIADARNMLGYK